MYATASSTSDSARARKLRSLQTAESLAMLSEPPLTPLSQDPSTDFVELPQAAPLSLQIALRRGRLALLVGLVTAIVIALTLVLSHGAELERFDRLNVTVKEQEEILDRYNSFSGTIASAIGRPLEIFVALMVQVIVLWSMTDSVLAFGTSWRVKVTVLGLGASVGFLLTNGLNALNVQVRELPLTLVMSTSDLGFLVTNDTNSSSVDKSFSEKILENPTANTILRSLILPSQRIPFSCSLLTSGFAMREDIISYAMPQRTWMKNFIPRAVAPESIVRIDLLTNTTESAVMDFPTNASIYSDLLVAGVYTRSQYAPFDAASPFNLGDDSLKSYPGAEIYAPTSRLAGLLPPDPMSSEAQDREWFLARSGAFVRAATSVDAQNTSIVKWTMEATRVSITSSVWVDAVTLESETAGDDHPSSSLVAFTTFEPKSKAPDAQVHAFAACLNKNGTDTLFSTLRRGAALHTSTIDCSVKSNTSMYVFSTGRHLVYDGGKLRVVSSTTFSRISWQLQDLSEIYGAACHDEKGRCMGLDAALSGNTTQRLLVSATALPTNQVAALTFSSWDTQEEQAVFAVQQPIEIVAVRRPTDVTYRSVGNAPSELAAPKMDSFKFDPPDRITGDLLGDLLLPHNIQGLSDSAMTWRPECRLVTDRRTYNYVNNHLYMESTLQPTYAAAALFLFQNGMEKDVLPSPLLPDGQALSTGVTLKLDWNVQEISVRLSIPKLNAVVTLAGCVALVAGLVMALFCSQVPTKAASDATQNVTTPHQVARVMLDDTTFPSLLLKRRLVHGGHEGDAGEFVIDKLTLQPASTNTEKERSIEV